MSEPPVKSNTIVLYAGALSPQTAQVNCFLDYKQLEFNIIYVDPLSRRQIRFTGQAQLPVLKIGEVWKTDPTRIGIWLEERFPDHPILGRTAGEQALILDISQWVNAVLVPAARRQLAEGESLFDGLRKGWRRADILNDSRRLPLPTRLLWPLLSRWQPLRKQCMAAVDRSEPLAAMRERLCLELLERLGKGPFLGELGAPSLADLAAYPQFILPYLTCLQGDPTFLRFPRVLGWMSRVQAHLPANPLLVARDGLRALPYAG